MGERAFGAQVGFGVATRYALDIGLDAIAERIGRSSARLRTELDRIDRVAVRDEGTDRCGIVTFTVDGIAAADVKRALGAVGINIGAPADVNAQWDLGTRGIDAVARAGVHYFNDDAELDRLVAAVADLTP